MSAGLRSVVLHGHFYQPPREDPWLDEVPEEPSATPFHDWNRRVERECYRAVVAARIPGPDGRIARIVNTLASISFDFGPTLLAWLEREAPSTYAAVLEADRISRTRFRGHGNALAMPYHHSILPLSSRRDKLTEVRWGIADFRRRFGREPRGMWLPETAVDRETLDVLAAEGIAFTVLAPHQVERPPALGLPGLCRTGVGRSIAVFVYDGGISHDVAFGALLRDSWMWAERLAARPVPHPGTELVSVATDGETFGHHHPFGEMALAAVLEDLGRREHVRVENFASFLARHPPREEVALVAPTAWSCAHGVERWRSDCGCKAAPERPTQQAWRAPLRDAVDWLAGELHRIYEREARELFLDPWAVRDAYGAVAGLPTGAARFVEERAVRPLDPPESVRARELLEMERDALRTFTSCGWFFDDIAGIEAVQVLRYAARAVELAGSEAGRLEAGLLERLKPARSNDAAAGNGARVYLERAKPRRPPPADVAAAAATLRHVDAGGGTGGDPDVAAAYRATVSGEDVAVIHRSTGRAFEYRVGVERPATGRIRLTVQGEGLAGNETLGLTDLPERPREALRRALREAVMERCFTPEEKEDLARGRGDVRSVASAALGRAVVALAGDADREAVLQVLDLADLMELLDLDVPFDVQTVFWRVRRQASPAAAAALRPVARALGFVDAGDADGLQGEHDA